MSEWGSYGLSDFLMFSPTAYWRLVERYNLAWWPGQIIGLFAAAALFTRALRPPASFQRAALLVLAAAWAWVGWAFHWQRYAELFLAAPSLAGACWVQAALLLAAALSAPRAEAGISPAARWASLLLIGAGLAYPLLAAMPGRSWYHAEVFGWMPEPTAIATLGALLALTGLPRWARVLLALPPVLSLTLGAVTRWLTAQ